MRQHGPFEVGEGPTVCCCGESFSGRVADGVAEELCEEGLPLGGSWNLKVDLHVEAAPDRRVEKVRMVGGSEKERAYRPAVDLLEQDGDGDA